MADRTPATQVVQSLLRGALRAFRDCDGAAAAAHLRLARQIQPVALSRRLVRRWFLDLMLTELLPQTAAGSRAGPRLLPPSGPDRAPVILRLIDLARSLELLTPLRRQLGEDLAATPDDARLQLLAGQLALAAQNAEQARQHLRRAAELAVPTPVALLGLAQLAEARGDFPVRRRLVVEAATRFPLFRDPTPSADGQRLLVLNALPRAWCSDWRDAYNHSNLIRSYAPLARQANRPIDVLMLGGLDSERLAALDLPAATAVFNNLGNAEVMAGEGHAALIAAIGSKTGVRLLNPPEAVLRTSRAANYARFGGDPAFVFPRTERFASAAPETGAPARQIADAFGLPVIIRSVINHEGKHVYLCRTLPELEQTLTRFAGVDFYAIQYHDCRTGPRTWRKFRILCIGGTVVPASVHVSDEWNVHLHRTREHVESGTEVEAAKSRFRDDPAGVIGAQNLQTIDRICAAVGLDLFGIDFGFDREGRLVVFEINANMRANPELCAAELERLLWRNSA